MSSALAAVPRSLRIGTLLPGALIVLVAWAVLATARDHDRIAPFAAMWVAMAVAMMAPSALRPMLRAADGSTARAWAFLAGFVLVWCLVGVPGYALVNAIAWTPFWIAVAWLAAGAYQVTPLLQRHLGSCRSIRFDGDPLAYGMRQGLRCVASCGPLMLAVMVTAMTLPGVVLPVLALVAAAAFVCWEKGPRTSRRAIAGAGIAMLLLAAGAYVVAGDGGGAHHPSVAAPGTSTS